MFKLCPKEDDFQARCERVLKMLVVRPPTHKKLTQAGVNVSNP